MTKTQKQFLLDRHNAVARLEAYKKADGDMEKSAQYGAERQAYLDVLIHVAKLLGQKGARKVSLEFHRVGDTDVCYHTYHLMA